MTFAEAQDVIRDFRYRSARVRFYPPNYTEYPTGLTVEVWILDGYRAVQIYELRSIKPRYLRAVLREKIDALYEARDYALGCTCGCRQRTS